jgi:ABC-type sugar transport system permease subunit
MPFRSARARIVGSTWEPLLWVAPAGLALLVVFVYPLVSSFGMSLENWNLISNIRRWGGASNYIAIVSNPALPDILRVTATYTILSVVLEGALGLGLAALVRSGLRRRLPGFAAMRVLIMTPLLVAPLIWAFYFRSFFSPQFGLFNIVLDKIGLPSVLWVNDIKLAIYSLVGADVWQWTPFMFSILLAGLMTLPEDIVEAARLDGAGGWTIFWLIEMPLLKPVVLVAILMRTIDSLRYLDLILIITQGGPGTSTTILNFLAYRTAFQEFQMGRGAALAFVVFAVVLVAVVALLRTMRRTLQHA